MNLKEFKNKLREVNEIKFKIFQGIFIPSHFHITEIGTLQKKFIDCGSKIRIEKTICLQIWLAKDISHRLVPQKVIEIIELAEKKLYLNNEKIEIEYQGDRTIEKFGLDFEGDTFVLTKENTDCLAKDACNSDNVINNTADPCCSSAESICC